MMDISSFKERQAKDLVRVVEATPDRIVLAYKQFDLAKASLGELAELPETVHIQKKQELLDRRTALQKEINNINEILLCLPSK